MHCVCLLTTSSGAATLTSPGYLQLRLDTHTASCLVPVLPSSRAFQSGHQAVSVTPC